MEFARRRTAAGGCQYIQKTGSKVRAESRAGRASAPVQGLRFLSPEYTKVIEFWEFCPFPPSGFLVAYFVN